MIATPIENPSVTAGSITRYLSGAGVALWSLVIALDPDVGIAASWQWMAIFWAVQISIGLVVLQLVLSMT